MPPPLPNGPPPLSAPSFSLIGRQPVRPGVILLAILAAVGTLWSAVYVQRHFGAVHLILEAEGAGRPSGAPAGEPTTDDDKDDPNQIDTIVLGDPADAPTPGRKGNHVSPVHPTIIVRLPRYGDQVGLIPDVPAGHLLYQWLAAFNQASDPALRKVLPNVALDAATDAQMELRKQNGGFNLLSAKEALPGVLVFRLRDQTPEGIEVLGTLQVREGSSPAEIGSFSLRAVYPVKRESTAVAAAPKP